MPLQPTEWVILTDPLEVPRLLESSMRAVAGPPRGLRPARLATGSVLVCFGLGTVCLPRTGGDEDHHSSVCMFAHVLKMPCRVLAQTAPPVLLVLLLLLLPRSNVVLPNDFFFCTAVDFGRKETSSTPFEAVNETYSSEINMTLVQGKKRFLYLFSV